MTSTRAQVQDKVIHALIALIPKHMSDELKMVNELLWALATFIMPPLGLYASFVIGKSIWKWRNRNNPAHDKFAMSSIVSGIWFAGILLASGNYSVSNASSGCLLSPGGECGMTDLLFLSYLALSVPAGIVTALATWLYLRRARTRWENVVSPGKAGRYARAVAVASVPLFFVFLTLFNILALAPRQKQIIQERNAQSLQNEEARVHWLATTVSAADDFACEHDGIILHVRDDHDIIVKENPQLESWPGPVGSVITTIREDGSVPYQPSLFITCINRDGMSLSRWLRQ